MQFNEERVKEFIRQVFLTEPTEAAINRLPTLLSELSDKEEKVVIERYGLISGSPKTLEEVAKMFSVKREDIRQIEVKAIKKFRHPARQKLLFDCPTPKKEQVTVIKDDTLLSDLDLSVRTSSVLKREGVVTVADLKKISFNDFKNMKNLGKKSLKELLGFISEHVEILF